jgi:AMMECR1 domain-containing protein
MLHSMIQDELKNIDIEISILSVPEQSSLSDIWEGEGVVLKKGLYQATYLPQVWEDIPSKDQFLSSLCMKAGIKEDCWKDEKTNFYTYSADVFSE